MTLIRFKAQNHPQQTSLIGSRDDVDDRGTHPTLFDPLHERFGFTVDVAAAIHNTKCARFYTKDDDGLTRSWAGETVWCNPPYSNIEPWVRKAWAEHRAHGITIAMLLPANRTEQGWWQDHVEPFRDRVGQSLTAEFLRGRIRFIRGDKVDVGPNERPPFGCVLLVWQAPDPLAPLNHSAGASALVTFNEEDEFSW